MGLEHINRGFLGFIISSMLIVIAEICIYLGYVQAAVVIHSINLIALICASAYIEDRSYLALMLLPIFRLGNLAMPVFFSLTLYSFALVYAPMLIPMYLVIKSGYFRREELGMTFKGWPYYFPLGVAIGLVVGWGEYQVIHPMVLTPELGLRGLVEISLTMIFFVGLVEEFIFRSALQTVTCERLGQAKGLLLASMLFGFMHGGYRLPTEILFTATAGLIFGLLFMKTSSLPMVSLAHGVTNVSLFLIVPAYSGLLLPLVILFLLIFSLVFLKVNGISKIKNPIKV